MIICPTHNMWYGTAIQKNSGLLNNSPGLSIQPLNDHLVAFLNNIKRIETWADKILLIFRDIEYF